MRSFIQTKYIIYTWLWIGALTTLGCSNTENPNDTIVYDLISKGNLYGDGAEGITQQNMIITTQLSWNALVSQMNTVNNVSDEFENLPIDYTSSTVIAVFDEVKSNGGYELELEIYSNQEQIEIQIISTSPGGNATTVITQPYIIVKIPKTDLPIQFQ
ncbi:MAG: protease complex subunit PrcB family protein [Bacteroidia bacterium]|nr:protease complex subunit PrcB family protein [Bacteroidia bacterium]